MPVKVDDTLLESKGLSQGMGNYPDLILAKRDGQKRIDDLNLAHANVVNLNTKQIAAQDLLDSKTKEKNAAVQAAKEAVVQVQEACKVGVRRRQGYAEDVQDRRSKAEDRRGLGSIPRSHGWPRSSQWRRAYRKWYDT